MHAFFGNQINYNIEEGGKGGDKHCKLRFLPSFISTIVDGWKGYMEWMFLRTILSLYHSLLNMMEHNDMFIT